MNFHTILEYHIGDKITYINEEGDIIDGQVYGFFDYWPSYIPQSQQYKRDEKEFWISRMRYWGCCQSCKDSGGMGCYAVSRYGLRQMAQTQYIYDYAEENELTFSRIL